MTEPASRPRFSIVTPVYNVEHYLPAFIDSVERQRFALDQVEVIAVDDGSTDGSLDVLVAWAQRNPGRVHVYTKPNGGQASARNLGLQHATGEWVTFPDPDDLLDRDYLRAADRFATQRHGIELMSARPILLHEASGALSTKHPRKWQYARGDRTAGLVDEPNVFLGVSAGSFYRLDRIRTLDLRFDTRIRPNFEDAHFAVRYLLDMPEPVIGLLRSAVYIYRKRAGGTSTLQGSMRHPGRYSDVLEHGYLDALERGRRPDGSIPAWLQQLIVYELSWYLSEDERITSTVALPDELVPRFHELFDRVLRNLEPEVVAAHRVRALAPRWRDVLQHAGRGSTWRSPYLVRTRADRVMRLRRVQYRFGGPRPKEAFRSGSTPIRPVYEKTMAHRYFGRDVMHERILWLPEVDGLEASIDGVEVPILAAWPLARIRARARTRLRDRLWLYRRQPPAILVRRLLAIGRRLVRRMLVPPYRLVARFGPYRRRYRGAWVFMDRIHDADDNAERLYEHVRAARPDINAWFVLERGSPDWARMRAAGAGRLVAHGSFAWKMLMLNCAWLISSHVDLAIARPRAITRITRHPTWRLAFLQHGVIKDDLSRWLNGRDLDLFVVSTEAELDSVVGEGSTYRFTRREVRNTGLPRFDRLLELGRAVPPDQRDLVIVAPTWRQWLTLPLADGSQRREVHDAFWDSEYVQRWTAVLASPAIAAAVARRGWRLGFMPHPNLQAILPALDLPDHVQPLSFAGTDVQALYGRCALLVTDYSSVAFNAAYLDRPVVYFQFDRAAMFGGSHVGRRGYFEYERDGYGPVVERTDDAVRAIVESIERGAVPAPAFQRRIDAAFPVRDGGSCARVVEAIDELSRPVPSPGR